MIRLLVSDDAVSDAEDILSYLHREAGPNVSERYARRFDAMVRQLIEFPESGVARIDLG